MTQQKKSSAILWTGGKDSALALDQCLRERWNITCLVTFVPERGTFHAHPIPFIKLQTAQMEIPHLLISIKKPWRRGYIQALKNLKKEHHIHTVITGDIAEVNGLPNWIRECSSRAGMKVHTPLWGCDRLTLLNRLVQRNFSVIISCVKAPYLDEKWLGKTITRATLRKFQAIRNKNGLDLCGENGEYHTLVTHGPGFDRPLKLHSFGITRRNDLQYLKNPRFQ